MGIERGDVVFWRFNFTNFVDFLQNSKKNIFLEIIEAGSSYEYQIKILRTFVRISVRIFYIWQCTRIH